MYKFVFIFVLFASQILMAEDYQNSKDFYGSVETRISSLEEQIRDLTGKLEEANHKNQELLNKIENLQKDIDFRFDEMKGKNSSGKQNVNSETTTKKQYTEKEINEQYEDAFSVLKDGDYEKAEISLKEFIKEFENHQLAGNAYYWLGETYLAIDNKDSAALNFLYSYKKFPKGNKASTALYKLGVTLGKIGKKKEACDSLKKLIETYPKLQTEIKTGATSEIKNLACNKIAQTPLARPTSAKKTELKKIN